MGARVRAGSLVRHVLGELNRTRGFSKVARPPPPIATSAWSGRGRSPVALSSPNAITRGLSPAVPRVPRSKATFSQPFQQMPRKKHRGRPPESRNPATLNKSVSKIDVAQLHNYISALRRTLAAKVQQQREYFERQLASLGGYGIRGRGRSSMPALTNSRRTGDKSIRCSS
jgi:hypothetical protein